jgi:UDP-N-acetylglucosamine diphosphorylase/glucosamine-1-phosphate N-acetyltransferase
MTPQICLYEDERFRQFFPATYMRPVFSLRSGIAPIYKRIERHWPQAEMALVVREQLSVTYAHTHPDYPVNIIKKGNGGVLFLNGRIRDFGDLPEQINQARISTRFVNGDQSVALFLDAKHSESLPSVFTPGAFVNAVEEHAEMIVQRDTSATLYERLWEVVADIEKEIELDFKFLNPPRMGHTKAVVHDGAHLVNASFISLGDRVEVLPGAVIDATNGPVCIGKGTRIEPHAAVFGPTYIGPNSVVLAGKITASSVGHTCRVGGELEESVFESFVNKYHAGFIGHSYVGSWVNFGAMTTNSDLKNNYSNIRVTVGGESVDTGSIKVGSFIGDHTKFGIGTLLNTGISIGVCCNIFGGILVADKEVPSFSWGSGGQWDRYNIDKAIDTTQRTCARRSVKLTEHDIELLRQLYQGEVSDEGVIAL